MSELLIAPPPPEAIAAMAAMPGVRIAPTILATSHGNYTLLFLIAGAIPVLGAALLLPMKGAR